MNKNDKQPGKKGKSWPKKLNAWLHLWLGLGSGLIVFIVSITGCIFVFQKDITEITHKDMIFVKPQSTPMLAPSVLQAKAQAAIGKDKPISYMTFYREPDRAWEFMVYKPGNDKAITVFGAVDYYGSVFVNPYTGAVTGIHDYKHDFFVIVKYLHWSLLLHHPIGEQIVGWSTLIFVILLITGLILWWPKKWTKATREQSFKVKWSAKFKRVNYDLHNVLGFYSMLFALVIAFTGMVWAFKWFQATVYVIAARSTTPPERKTFKSDTLQLASNNGLDIAYAHLLKEMPAATRFGASEPAAAAAAPLYMSAYFGKETYYDRDDFQFDKNTGKMLYRQQPKEKNAGERLIGMNYDIHVGAIAGLPGKILAFIISLICASLPVTGLLVWLNKGKKKAKEEKKKVRAAVAAV
jgi:uncharacterized iron-regulated membrane protein